MDDLKNVAGYGVGTLAALTTIKSGGLGAYLMNRQRMMSDPGFRASLAGSPFAAGVFGVSGETGPVPAAPGQLPATAAGGGVAAPLPTPAGTAPVVQPGPYASGYVFPSAPGQQVAQPGTLPEPTAQNVPGYMPGTARQWMPNLPPYDPKAALEQRGLATTELGIGSSNAGQRAQYKMAGGIPLNDEEMVAATKRATVMQGLGGPGTVVKLDIPGMTTTVGSPYNFSPVTSEEYPTYALAAAAAAAKNASIPPGNPQWTVAQSGRGTFLLSQPATPQQVAPAHPPAPAPAPEGPAPGAQPSQPPAPAAQPNVVSSPPPQPPPAPAAPPRPPSVALPPSVTAGLPAPAPSYAGGPWDLNAPAPGAQRGRVGYPSAAFDDTGAVAAPSAAPPELLAAPPAPAVAPAPAVTSYAPPGPPPQARAGGAGGGNTVAIRNNNPGNITASPTTLRYPGVVGTETVGSRTFLRFDSPESGYAGMEALLQGPGYRSLPFDAAMRRWTTGTTQPTFDQQGRPQGYDLPAMTRRLGIDPSQPIASLSNDQRQALVREMSVREGFSAGGGGPARAVSVAAMPAAAPVASPGMFARIFAPSSAEAAEIPPGAVVAGPPTRGAGAAPSPDIVPPGQPTPPARVVPPMPPPPPGPAPAPVEPETKGTANVPLSRVTVRGTDGVEYSYDYGSPSDFAADMASAGIKTGLDNATAAQLQRLKELQDQRYKERLVTDADVQRFMRPQTEAEKEADNQLGFYRRAVDNLYQDFPNPSDRDTYIGWLNRPAFELVQLVHDNPRFARFVNDVAPFNNFNDIKRSLPVFLQNALGPYVPTGGERHASDFEQHLFDFRSELDEQQLLRNAANRMPAGQVTPQWMDAQRERFRNERMQNATSEELDAMGFTPPGLRPPPPAPSRGGEPPPPTVQVTPPPPQAPITYYGHSVAQ
jgi:hypothetical protein